ncbi:hypothetical protein H2200_008484 [Cladophialophora chaetospira]|uniref:glutathione transferase n=1 Tax=Cladophialophora chaetospira TaxID=386627 RepID=A0AA38X602_9EURO|nr:hypothetical protein H2200_008484 [Cladophialophora chaetospira]
MTLKLWTAALSWNCLRVELVLAEKGVVDVERVEVDLVRRTFKTPDFLEKSIYGKVPLFEVDDVLIFESRAICRYLCLKYPDVGSHLIPELRNPEERGVWEMRLLLEATEFDVNISPVFAETIIKPALQQTPDEVILARHQPRLETCLDVLNKTLSEIPFLGGQEFSLVDVFYMPGIYCATKCIDVFGNRHALKKWWDGVSERKAWAVGVVSLDDFWVRVSPGWKSSPPVALGEEEEGNRAHL